MTACNEKPEVKQVQTNEYHDQDQVFQQSHTTFTPQNASLSVDESACSSRIVASLTILYHQDMRAKVLAQ